MNIGNYWYDDKEKHRSVEFGVVLKFMDGYEVYEVKHPSDKMTRELVDCEAMKIRAIPAFKVRKTDFVSLEGFDFSSYEYVLVDGTMFYDC